jgi:hypothetical protein
MEVALHRQVSYKRLLHSNLYRIEKDLDILHKWSIINSL